ncbi:NTP-PPase_u5 domain containing protein [uncultured Caudovirales phage]|uniref:NTP-PPase_u5 domain containing protein n=1 Tax=uncultured Caudovirales phage TaxID=2100421 RepID=A0A6J5NKL9_9CAUD|nr:NTP-PPase_u5 domain containing protein [uncultured Caudovirales phage]
MNHPATFPPHNQSVVTMAGRELQRECHAASFHAGWWHFGANNLADECQSRSRFGLAVAAEKIALIHSEVSEALEGIRKNKQDEHLPHRKSVEVELADAVIRIADLAGALGLDLGGAIAEKMAYNAQRADHKPEARAAAGGKAF